MNETYKVPALSMNDEQKAISYCTSRIRELLYIYLQLLPMYFKLGNTKILAGKFYLQNVEKVEINFEYIFNSNNNYRRFANVISDSQGKNITINIKAKFNDSSDCIKLSELLIGVDKIVTQNSIFTINQILDNKSSINVEQFIASKQRLIKYFW